MKPAVCEKSPKADQHAQRLRYGEEVAVGKQRKHNSVREIQHRGENRDEIQIGIFHIVMIVEKLFFLEKIIQAIPSGLSIF